MITRRLLFAAMGALFAAPRRARVTRPTAVDGRITITFENAPPGHARVAEKTASMTEQALSRTASPLTAAEMDIGEVRADASAFSRSAARNAAGSPERFAIEANARRQITCSPASVPMISSSYVIESSLHPVSGDQRNAGLAESVKPDSAEGNA
jgi:hypothetical protein